ncbi:hypothetical protein J5I95_18765 [Candidatus Poribacteria bacterium]|nr:hypothetical protein [Candidatus Poribacteria bacterium]
MKTNPLKEYPVYYPDMREYITFLFLMLDEFSATQEKVSKRGRPETYSDASLIVFYAVMTLKGITSMRAQQTYLFHHPLYLESCQLPACPGHVTLGRRYKALMPKLQAFTEYIAVSRFAKEAGFLQEVVYEDKSLFKAAGPVWHQKDRLKDHLPEGLRGVDETATWSKSGYHGWVYGYGLHLTNIRNGFPVMFDVLPANVNELKVLDTKKDRLIEKGVRCIVADNGYVDEKRQTAFAETEVLLLTPKTTLVAANACLGADPLYTATQVHTWQKTRKVAIEPVFDLLSKLLSITGAHKPLPLRGVAYVATFLGIGIVLLQLAMLINVRCRLPTRNITHIKTVFR